MIEVKCYVCKSLFCIEPKHREFEVLELKRKKYHIAKSYVKKTIKCGLHCPYCGEVLLDKVLKEVQK